MTSWIKLIILVGSTFILGQYSIIFSEDPEIVYNEAITLGELSYKLGCTDAKGFNCKIKSKNFKDDFNRIRKR